MSAAAPIIATSEVGPIVRIYYRNAAGVIQLNPPVERVGEALADPDGTLWVDIEDREGRSVAWVEALFRDVFGFHPLAIDDALSEANVPKLDDWDQYLYVLFKAIAFDPTSDELVISELDTFLGRNYLVTYHNQPLGLVDRVRELVERDAESQLKRRPDHILYLLLDQGIAEHLATIGDLDEAVDDVQDEVFDQPTQMTLQRIFRLKRAASRMHRVIAPQREVANRLARDLYPQIDERDRVYFRDVYDGLVRLNDVTENVRDLVTVALDTYLSVSANRTNEIMKTLTIVSVLFLPLNFIVGFFGMNFFGADIAMVKFFSLHTLVFALACVLMGGSAVLVWLWGKHRGWY